MIATLRVQILAVILVLATVWLHFGLSQGRSVPIHRSLKEFPFTLGAWRGTDLILEERMAEKLGVEAYVNRLYRNGKAAAGLYIGYYETQRQGETMHSPKNCLPGAGWNIIEAEEIHIPTRTGTAGPRINKYIVQNGIDRQIVFYWYHCRGRVITNDYWSRIYLVLDALTKRRTDGAIIRIALPIHGESAQAEAEALRQGLEFTRIVFPELSNFIPG